MYRVGVVGVGAIAQAYIKALEDTVFARIVAVADIRIEAANAVAETAKCRGFKSYKDMADNEELDLVIISTPPDTHRDIAIYFLKRNIPVLCEKPLAINVESAEEIINTAQETGTTLSMASKFRFVDDVIRLKSIIESGTLGEIQLVENTFVSPVDMTNRWNCDPEISGGGVLIDNGTHSVDIMRYLLGPITRVLALTNTHTDNLLVEDNVSLHATTRSGSDIRIDLSWTFDKQLGNYISVYGTRGTAHVGWQQSKYKLQNNSDWILFGDGYDKISAFRKNVENICSAIKNSESPLVTADDALASVRVIQAAYLSAEKKSWVNVPELYRERASEILSEHVGAAE